MHIWKVRGNRFCSNLVEITYTVYIGIMYATYRTSNSLCHFPSSYSPENLMAYDTITVWWPVTLYHSLVNWPAPPQLAEGYSSLQLFTFPCIMD